MDEPRSASRRWLAILLPAIFAGLLLLALAVWQHCMPAELRSRKAAPPPAAPSGETGLQPAGRDCLFPGSGTDYFGECPDSEGYYSSRRHFDSDSPNRLRRALVMLEMDADRSLHLRLSKADLASMPTVEETLPLAEFAPDETADDPIARDSLLPAFEFTRYEDHGDGTAGVFERRLSPPFAGFELRLNGDEINELLQLHSVNLATGAIVWTEEGLESLFDRIEFLAPDSPLFFLFSYFRGGGVFDLRKGLVCRYQRDAELRSGIFRRLPLFLDDGRQFQFVEGETIWRLDLSNCRRRAIGTIVLPPRELARAAELESVATTSDGTVVLATIGEGFAGVVALASDPSPSRRQHVWLEYDGERYVERRRVTVRSHNAISGFDGLSRDLARDPLLVAGYFQDFQLDPATGKPDRQSRSGDLSHVLIRNRQGNFYALRTSARSTLFRVDSRRGLLNYAGRWWDLKVLDRPLESDLR